MPPAYRKVAMTNLPVHPYTKLTAIGFRRDGRPIWPVMGGDGTTPAPTGTAPTPSAEPVPAAPPPPPGLVPADQNGGAGAEDQRAQELLAVAMQNGADGDPDQLGDAGKRALVAERERAKAAEKLAAEQAKQLEDLRKQYDGLKPAADVFAKLRQAVLPPEEKTDLEQLTERLAAQEKATAEERLARTRLEVIGDLKLGKEWVEFLRGDTYDEMKAYAEKLLALMPKPESAPAATAEPGGDQLTAGDPPTTSEPKKKAPTPKPDPSQGARGATPSRSTSLAAAIGKAMSSGG